MVSLACASPPAWRRRIVLTALALLAALTHGCSDLPVIASSGCGNRVIEPSEDCDEPTGATAFVCAQPGDVHACRYLCERGSSTRACPDGYACGADGLCRTSVGDFVSVGRPIEAASATLEAGDFDGDGATDLLALGQVDVLGRSAGQVVFFSDATRQASLVSLPGQVGAPVVGHFSAIDTPAGPQPSPYAGVALLEVPGIITLIGRRDRQFFARAYPTFSPPLVQQAATYAFDLLPTRSVVTTASGVTSEVLINRADEILLHVTRDGQNVLLTPDPTQDPGAQADDPAIQLQQLPAGPQDLFDDLRAGRLDESLPCPSLLFAFRASPANQLPEPSLYTYLPCKLTSAGGVSYYDWARDQNPVQSIPLRSVPGLDNPRLQGPPMVVDMDGDQHLDVIAKVSVEFKDDSGATRTTSVAYVGFGDGKGGLSAPVDPWGGPGSPRQPGLNLHGLPGAEVGPAQGAWDCGVRLGDSGLLAGPLAAGDLDGDGRVDFVTEQGVCISRDLAAGGTAGSGGSGQAGGGGDPAPPGVRYRLTIAPLGTVLASAALVDLDGDGRLDVVSIPYIGSSLVVFLNQGDDAFTEVDVPLNGPPSRLRVGDFDGDGVGDVAFVEGDVQIQSNASASGDALAVLFGSRDQAPSTVVRMGRFDHIDTIGAGRTALLTNQSDAASDLGVASRTFTAAKPAGEIGISLLDGSSDRAMRSPAVLCLGLSTSVTAGRFTSTTLPGQHDLAVLNLSQEAPPTRTLHVAPVQGDAQLRTGSPIAPLLLAADEAPSVDLDSLAAYGRLFAGDLDGDQLDEIVLLDQAATGGARLRVARVDSATSSVKLVSEHAMGLDFAAASSLLVADVDGDGRNDVLVTGQRTGGSDIVLALLRGQGGGTLAAAQLLMPPAATDPAAAGATSGLPPELTGPLCAQRVGGRTRVLALGDVTTWELGATDGGLSFTPVAGLEDQGGYALACADFDGDGVGDVALSSGSLIQVFRGAPVRP